MDDEFFIEKAILEEHDMNDYFNIHKDLFGEVTQKKYVEKRKRKKKRITEDKKLIMYKSIAKRRKMDKEKNE